MNILFNLKQKFEKFDENWRSDLEKTFSSSNKKSAEKHAFWIDHEFLRIFYHNNFQIAPGVFRSNQPSEKRILEWQREKGIQSIINFRGESNQGAFFIEKNICKEIGIKLINIKLYSSKLPEKEKIFEINEVFKTIKIAIKHNFFYIQVIHSKFLYLFCRYLVDFLIDYESNRR